MNPWGQLEKYAGRRVRMEDPAPDVAPTGHVRDHLVSGPKSTRELEQLTDLSDRQIWGRLKHDLAIGRVRRVGDKFELAPLDPQELDAIAEAKRLLRRHGYTVTKKRGRHG